ncbi:MAG: cobalamin B12-binding domain-containing protein [Chloroflexota bacterium]
MTRKALVVNCSAPKRATGGIQWEPEGRKPRGWTYNLGAAKLANWLRDEGWDVAEAAGDVGLLAYGYDLVALSVIFSWHAPLARDIALRVKANSEVWAGGPGLFALGPWWTRETGLQAQRGLDDRFERQPGQYKMVFASRGCPVGCWWCIVPQLEGREFTLNWDFRPAATLGDNNLSALALEFQRHIVRRYQDSGQPLIDANSGFEPSFLTEEVFDIWEPLLSRTGAPWRFAFDEEREREAVLRVIRMLRRRGVSSRRIRCYTLLGNEPIEQCLDRVWTVIAEGGEPFAAYIRQLNELGGPLKPRHDWTERLAIDAQRYINRFVWRRTPITAYRPRRDGTPAFAFLAGTRFAHLPVQRRSNLHAVRGRLDGLRMRADEAC